MKGSWFLVILLNLTVLLCSCQNLREVKDADHLELSVEHNATAYFASGCFWCVEAIFESIKGVGEVYNGYAGGHALNPTYEQSNTGKTGHAEAVKIEYDSNAVDFSTLVDVYFGSQNIEQVNGQGPDHGSQYRSIAFYQNDRERSIIEKKKSELEKMGYRVASEIKEYDVFWMGEKYHQDYKKLHPDHPYVQSVSNPRLKAFKKKFPGLLK